MKLRVFLASCVIALAGCAGMNLKLDPDTIEQAVDDAVQVAATLYQAKKINDKDAQAIIDAANTVYSLAEASKSSAAAGDKSSAAAQLRAASDALDTLNTRIAAKKGS